MAAFVPLRLGNLFCLGCKTVFILSNESCLIAGSHSASYLLHYIYILTTPVVRHTKLEENVLRCTGTVLQLNFTSPMLETAKAKYKADLMKD